MGKGDKKTKKGKIVKGSFGVRRPKKNKNIKAGLHNPQSDKKENKNKKENKKVTKKK